jgi:3-dehydroquinate synthetase
MVDAGIGGKTGIDLPEGKNLAGAFHAPALVWIDPLVLATLPEDEIRNGMAEVVKHGVIADPRLFDQVSGGFPAIPEDWERLVSRAVGVKVRIICADPYEAGLRASLNLGHTIGHGVETASHYSLRHGEAVSIGMVQEAHLAERIGLADKGLAEQIADVLTRLGLPVGIPAGLDVDEILQTMTHDKKRSDGKLRFSLPVRIGEVRVGISVEPSDLLSILHSGR